MRHYNEGLDLAAKGQQIDVLVSLGCGDPPPGEAAPSIGGNSPNVVGVLQASP